MLIARNNFDKINVLISALQNDKIWNDCFPEYLVQGGIVSRTFSFKICVIKSFWILEEDGGGEVSLKKN